jgi:hypothetical protein
VANPLNSGISEHHQHFLENLEKVVKKQGQYRKVGELKKSFLCATRYALSTV